MLESMFNLYKHAYHLHFNISMYERLLVTEASQKCIYSCEQ